MSELVGKIRQLTQHASTDSAKVLIDAAALVQEAVEAERERIASMVEARGCTGLPKHGGPLCGDEGYIDENCLKHAIAAMIRES